MILVYIKLKNVAGIYAGLGINKLEIDFTNAKYDFNIINGTNGSGKSTLLNSIDPYAVENIIEGKKGYKEIRYSHKGEMFIVKHFYEPTKTGHSVKSFITKISKDGVIKELNENGNVTSFKEIVSVQLGVNPETMKLLKLGSDAVNLVNMTPAERKKFMSRFTKDVDIYLILYKKINSDYIMLSKLVKNYSDKLKSLGKLSIVEEEIEELENDIVELENEETKYVIDISSIHTKKESVWDSDKSERLENLEIEFDKNKKTKNKIEKEFGLEILNKDSIYIKDEITKLESEIQSNKKSLSIFEESILNVKKDIDIIREKIFNSNIELDKIELNDYKEDFIEDLKSLESFSSKYKKIYNKYKDITKTVNKSYLIELESFLKNKMNDLEGILDVCNSDDLYKFEFGVDYDKSYNISNQNIWKYNNIIDRYEEEKMKDTFDISKLDCTNLKCPLLLAKMDEINEQKEKETQYNEAIEKMDIEKNKSKVFRAFSKLKILLTEIKNKIDNIDKNILDIINLDFNSVLRYILNGNSIFYDTEQIVDLISKIEIVNEYDDTKEQILKLKLLEREVLYKNKIESDINHYNQELQDNISKRDEYVNKIDNLKYSNNDLIENKENLLYLLDNKKSFDELASIEKEINELKDMKYKSNEYDAIISDLKEKMDITISKKDFLNKEREDKIFLKKTIKKTMKQKAAYENNFKDIQVLREVLSTNKGIPLIFIKSYLQKTRKLVNEILNEVFDGERKLDKFVINDKEFRIPLKTGNGINSDISNASSGERSIISLAFTLALTEQNKISNMMYRILLLDEVDGPLDAGKRRKFLNLLEKRTKKLKIKQSFMITHNDCFNDYPVNLILFKGHTLSDLSNKNIIYQYE